VKDYVKIRANELGFSVHHGENAQELGGWDFVAVDRCSDARIQR